MKPTINTTSTNSQYPRSEETNSNHSTHSSAQSSQHSTHTSHSNTANHLLSPTPVPNSSNIFYHPHYIRKELIGNGAFKTVYKAYDSDEGLEVAWNQVKIAGVRPDQRQKIAGEISLLEKVNHPNIIRIFNSWETPNGEYLVFITEIMTSGTLRDYIREVDRVKLKTVKKWCRQILDGLVYLHSSDPPIIHRDIKCDNILLNGNRGEVKIGDLGLSICMRDKKFASSVIGTPEFMAPELYEEKYNEKVDIYAFGMCVLEMVTGEYPYSECVNAAQVYKRVSQGIKPEGIAKISDKSTKEFIEMCISDGNSRPSASQLLQHPFMQPDPSHDDYTFYLNRYSESDTTERDVTMPFYPNPNSNLSQFATQQSSHTGTTTTRPNISNEHKTGSPQSPAKASHQKNILDDDVTTDSHPEDTSDESASERGTPNLEHTDTGHKRQASNLSTLVTDTERFKEEYSVPIVVIDESNDEHEEDKTTVKMRLYLKIQNNLKEIKFNFNLHDDTPDAVASEMVSVLELSNADYKHISEGIAKSLHDRGYLVKKLSQLNLAVDEEASHELRSSSESLKSKVSSVKPSSQQIETPQMSPQLIEEGGSMVSTPEEGPVKKDVSLQQKVFKKKRGKPRHKKIELPSEEETTEDSTEGDFTDEELDILGDEEVERNQLHVKEPQVIREPLRLRASPPRSLSTPQIMEHLQQDVVLSPRNRMAKSSHVSPVNSRPNSPPQSADSLDAHKKLATGKQKQEEKQSYILNKHDLLSLWHDMRGKHKREKMEMKERHKKEKEEFIKKYNFDPPPKVSTKESSAEATKELAKEITVKEQPQPTKSEASPTTNKPPSPSTTSQPSNKEPVKEPIKMATIAPSTTDTAKSPLKGVTVPQIPNTSTQSATTLPTDSARPNTPKRKNSSSSTATVNSATNTANHSTSKSAMDPLNNPNLPKTIPDSTTVKPPAQPAKPPVISSTNPIPTQQSVPKPTQPSLTISQKPKETTTTIPSGMATVNTNSTTVVSSSVKPTISTTDKSAPKNDVLDGLISKNIDTLLSSSNTPVMQENYSEIGSKKPIAPANGSGNNLKTSTTGFVPPAAGAQRQMSSMSINVNSVGTPTAGNPLSPPTLPNSAANSHDHLASLTKPMTGLPSQQQQQQMPPVTKPLTSSRVSFIDLEEISKQTTAPSQH